MLDELIRPIPAWRALPDWLRTMPRAAFSEAHGLEVRTVVVGPKDLPQVLRTVGQVVGKARRVARDVQNQFTGAFNEAELDNVKKELRTINETANIDISLNNSSV